MSDIAIRAIRDDGDMTLRGNDLEVFEGYENWPYLGTFSNGPDGADWWGNYMQTDGKDLKFSAETELILNTTPLTSSGRVKIEEAVLRDLKFITANVPGTILKVTAQIISDDKLTIGINMNGQQFFINWNPEYVEPIGAPVPVPPTPATPLYWWPAENIIHGLPGTLPPHLGEWQESQQGGGQYDLNQFDGAAPDIEIVEAGLNGQNYLKFNGVVGENVYTANKIDIGGPVITLVMVMQKGVMAAGNRRIASLCNPAATFEAFDDTFGVVFNGSQANAQVRYNPIGTTKQNIYSPGTSWHIYEYALDRAGDPTLYIDGVLVSAMNFGAGTTPADFGVYSFFLGCATIAPVTANIAEIMIFNAPLTISERSLLVSSLQTKFAL